VAQRLHPSGRVTVGLPWNLIKTLDRECDRYGISRSYYLEDILIAWWKDHHVPIDKVQRGSPTQDELLQILENGDEESS
jgi:hypothetical protein